MSLSPASSRSSAVVVTEYDYVEHDLSGSGGKLNVPVGSPGTTTTLWIQGNAVSYDGATRICVEFYIAAIEADFQNAVVFNLYEGATDLGAICDQATGNSSTTGNRGGRTALGRRFLTPAAGSHTYSIRCWATGGTTNNAWSGNNGGGVGTAPIYMASYYRITAA